MAVPKLRFKDENGADYPEWEKKRIFEIANIIDGDRGKNYPKENELLDSGYCLFLNTKNVTKQGLDFTVNQFITKEKDSLLRSGKLNKNDLVITSRGTVGNVGIFDDTVQYNDMRINSGMLIIRPKNILPLYLYQILKSEFFEKQLKLIISGNAQPQLTQKNFIKLIILVPYLEEQKKIADFLTTFDKRITTQQNIIADMEEIKKGLLQKIFSQEIRFKDDNGEDYPEWKEKLLGEICNIFKGASLSKSDISDNGTPFILYGELYTTYSEVAYNIIRKTNKIVDEKYFSEIGDVLVPTSGETAEEISTATCVMIKGVILAGDLNIIRSDVIDGRILSYMLNHEKKHDLAKVAQGASVVHSKADGIKKLKISIPSKDEQNKIASFLSTYDKKIEAEKKILADLQEMKKGLLQQMFV